MNTACACQAPAHNNFNRGEIYLFRLHINAARYSQGHPRQAPRRQAMRNEAYIFWATSEKQLGQAALGTSDSESVAVHTLRLCGGRRRHGLPSNAAGRVVAGGLGS